MTITGQRSMPFWSKGSRAQKVIDNVQAYAGMRVVELTADEWLAKWLPDLDSDGLLVGVNWSGKGASGYDVSPADAARNVSAIKGLCDAERVSDA